MTRTIPLILLVTGALLVVIPILLFPVCFYAGGSHHARMMPCFATGTITQGIGTVTVLCALVALLASAPAVKRGALLVAALAAAALFVIFLVAPGVCGMMTMPCRVGTLPAALVTGGVQLVAAVAGLAGRRQR